ncbi:MAG: cytochrome c biogenesis protein CcdA [Kiritimatiellia bacterium]
MKCLFAILFALTAFLAPAKPVCVGEMCYPSEEMALAAGVPADKVFGTRRLGFGYMRAPEFLAFLRNEERPAEDLENHSLAVIFLLVLLGGLAANLTPCVLPLVPVNLALVGKGWRRGAAYGLGIAVAYGALGLAAAFGGLAFGAIQGNPWFNLFVAGVFLVLGLAMAEVFFIDFARHRTKLAKGGPFLLGVGAAVLAGACVEPILLATLLLTAKWHAAGKAWAVVLPFVLGAGMGLPWPFAAAGLSVLPKPGAWMRWVNRAFAAVLFVLAAWYGCQGVRGLLPRSAPRDPAAEPSPGPANRPRLVILGAPWCKNCTAMEKTTLRHPDVLKALAGFDVRHVEIERFDDLKNYPELADLPIRGVPAYVVIAASETPAENGAGGTK